MNNKERLHLIKSAGYENLQQMAKLLLNKTRHQQATQNGAGHNPGSVGAFFEPKKVAPQTHTPGSVGAFFEPKK